MSEQILLFSLIVALILLIFVSLKYLRLRMFFHSELALKYAELEHILTQEAEYKFNQWKEKALTDEAKALFEKWKQTTTEQIRKDAILRSAHVLIGKIGEQIRLGKTKFFNEHRLVTVVFVSFSSLDFENDVHVGDKLQQYYSTMEEIVDKYNGRLNEFEAGDKGCKIILFFGAPTSYENDTERAILCSLAIRKEGKKLPFIKTQSIGITTGYVFTGFIGGEKREIYTAIGDKVNLSARLMVAAQPGEILCDKDTYEAAKTSFHFSDSRNIRVKGKQDEVTVYAIKGAKFINNLELQEPEYKLPMVGRKQELKKINELMELALKGSGQIIGITADAGMGKSRLNTEVIKLAMSKGIIGFGGMTQSYGTKVPYLVWHNLLRGFFNLPPELPRQEQIERLKKKLESFENLGVDKKLNIVEESLSSLSERLDSVSQINVKEANAGNPISTQMLKNELCTTSLYLNSNSPKPSPNKKTFKSTNS